MIKYFSLLVFILLTSLGCQIQERNSIIFEKEHYHILKPTNKADAVLFLFGGYPETPKQIQQEFDIKSLAVSHNVTVIYMNYNMKLWLETEDKKLLSKRMSSIIKENKLASKNIFIGGFSSGGNVAFLIGNYLSENIVLGFKPKGIFLIDSPIDLVALYKSSVKNIVRDFSDVSVNESTHLIETLSSRFGNPTDGFKNYEQHSVFTSLTDNIKNLAYLKNTKIRLYTEPDYEWWKTNRRSDPDQLNAFYIQKLSSILKENNFENVEYIPTEDKGFRSNGVRHPHSWSIVEKEEFMKWLVE